MKKNLGASLVILLFLVSGRFIYGYLQPLVVVEQNLIIKEDRKIKIKLATQQESDEAVVFTIKDYPQQGKLERSGQYYHYIPAPNFNGQDYFTFYATLGQRKSEVGKVDLWISPVNDPPIVSAQSLQVLEDESIALSLSFEDPDQDPAKIHITSWPTHGVLEGTPPNLKYIPRKDFFGEDEFSFVADDGLVISRQAKVRIEIFPVNDAPTLESQEISITEGQPALIALKATDKEQQALSILLLTPPLHGRLVQKQGQLTYFPDPQFVGEDTFSLKMSDGFAQSNEAWVKIKVLSNFKIGLFQKKLQGLLEKGGVAVGKATNPDYLLGSGSYIPASSLKLITAVAALEALGENYHFRTKIHIDQRRNLILEGFGDPALSSTDWHKIAVILRDKGIFKSPLNRLILDSTNFVEDLEFDGRQNTLHYFDAPLGALPSNFNTAAVYVKKGRRVVSAKSNTPLTSHVRKRVRRLPVGYQFFNVAKDARAGTVNTGELAQAIFSQYGAIFKEKNDFRKLPKGSQLILEYFSPLTLLEVIKKMLKDSNNFVANQLLLVMAWEKYGAPASLPQGVAILTSFLKEQVGLQQQEFSIHEGSGLSRKNHIDLQAMLKVLEYAAPYKNILSSIDQSHFRSLAKSGKKWKILAKTGTLRRVSNVVGYLQTRNKEWKPFVIMVNQDRNTRGRILNLIGTHFYN
ncbi:MAG: hypothetical protein COB67_04575 [SAR324 cluster bacterium]|uniref:D-alanyl-D-alanine carboxypeptidase/D-alanyl-D-alanine-endopeptidase n=1 Tax=SAR324 cluster bacterium TaxID=2024889 RepID=A0A2A4T7R3_9DELT|nr:MAG: hypothetical protein COB67_04575 [SAR324 cluster bacterium]